VYRRKRGWTEENRRSGPGWVEEALSLRPNRTQDREEKPSGSERADGEEGECRDLLHRLQADFVNYRGRVERERDEQVRSANSTLILKLLPVVDDFARALETMPQAMADADWVKGMALIKRKLMATLEEEGLKRIEAEGKDFDPWEHEAVFCEGSADHDEDSVRAVLRDGYKFHDRVIRPAQVVVSKGMNRTNPSPAGNIEMEEPKWQRYWE
jgi:molecular chaperone GrpE